MPATSKPKEKILLAMSGGVDSSVCAHLLKQQGYRVYGIVFQMIPEQSETVFAAQQAAMQIGVPLYVKQLFGEFKENVIDYFTSSYRAGATPNPCVVCNPTVKFKSLLQAADDLKIDKIATGHYARLVTDGDGVVRIQAGDEKRDQSYMLYRLGQDVLTRLVFPLADYPKPEVRKIADELGLSCADAPDSQENCFIPDDDYAGYIERAYGKSPEGDFIAPDGTVCGRHKGIIHYTVGQRKRLGIALGRPVFITKIDPDQNSIYLADADDAFAESVNLSNVVSVSGKPFNSPFKCGVKIRSVAKITPAEVIPTENGGLTIKFDTPQRAPAKGQSVVLYNSDSCVLGGGFIKDDIR